MNEIQVRHIDPGYLPDLSHYNDIPEDFDPQKQFSIETGYFVFTMMPSLRCDLNCPHCYLSLDQRRNSPIMSLDDLDLICKKVDEYYQSKPWMRKVIVCYWYGGEPTQMGQPYMLEAFKRMQAIFTEEKGYYVRHDILTSLLNVDPSWYDIFRTWGRGHFQTSFDGLMRGKGYMRKWDKKIREAVKEGLSVATISVVNNELVADGPKAILDYLMEIGAKESSFLPFMLNEQNMKSQYEKFAPPMAAYSDFMIELSEYWAEQKRAGNNPPHIGQMCYILGQSNLTPGANIAGQTMFLLPEGDFVLPDYKDGYLEFMKPFGNILAQSFREVLESRSRRDYLRRQHTRNFNQECIDCSYKDQCIMEFWKENREGDDCFGAKKYVQWLTKAAKKEPEIFPVRSAMLF